MTNFFERSDKKSNLVINTLMLLMQFFLLYSAADISIMHVTEDKKFNIAVETNDIELMQTLIDTNIFLCFFDYFFLSIGWWVLFYRHHKKINKYFAFPWGEMSLIAFSLSYTLVRIISYIFPNAYLLSNSITLNGMALLWVIYFIPVFLVLAVLYTIVPGKKRSSLILNALGWMLFFICYIFWGIIAICKINI